MKLWFTIFGILLCNLLFAQTPWQQNNSTWYYSYYGFAFDGYLKYQKQGDTTINNIYCDRLIKTIYGYNYLQGSFTTITGREYTYISNDTVFYFFHNQFHILYVFSAQPGDSWPVLIDTGNGCNSPNGSFLIDSVSSVVISLDTLKILYGKYFIDTVQQYSTSIIEKIGDSIGLIPYFACILDASGPEGLRCYSDSANINFSTNIYPACDYTTGIPEIASSYFKIFPNPANDKLFIQPDVDVIKEIKIFNTLGQTILKFNYNLHQIDLHQLQVGIYFIEIKNEDRTYVKKFLRE